MSSFVRNIFVETTFFMPVKTCWIPHKHAVVYVYFAYTAVAADESSECLVRIVQIVSDRSKTKSILFIQFASTRLSFISFVFASSFHTVTFCFTLNYNNTFKTLTTSHIPTHFILNSDFILNLGYFDSDF